MSFAHNRPSQIGPRLRLTGFSAIAGLATLAPLAPEPMAETEHQILVQDGHFHVLPLKLSEISLGKPRLVKLFECQLYIIGLQRMVDAALQESFDI